MRLHATVVATSAGPLSLVADGDLLAAAGFTGRPAELQGRLDPRRRGLELRDRADLGPLSKAVQAYLDGDLAALDGVPVEQPGTPQQQRVWAALRDVPAGETVPYAELARRAGNPAAVRAAGTACGRNIVAPVVPCHRAVRSDGSLGGYAYGLHVKRWLLQHERRHAGFTLM